MNCTKHLLQPLLPFLVDARTHVKDGSRHLVVFLRWYALERSQMVRGIRVFFLHCRNEDVL